MKEGILCAPINCRVFGQILASKVSRLEAVRVLRQLRFGSYWRSGCGVRLPPSACKSPDVYSYQQSAGMSFPSADGYGRPPYPQVDRIEVRPHLCTRRAGTRVRTCGAGTRDASEELGGQGPLASSPWSDLTPIPSCPASLLPQHWRVASSCGKTQPRITERAASEDR